MNDSTKNTSLVDESRGQLNFTGKKHVLVTGGTGFLGAYIIKNLIEKGFSVSALRRSDKLPFFLSSSISDKVNWVEGDILEVISLSEAMQEANAVIHSAAIVSFAEKERHQMYQVNVEGTANVVNAAIENGIKRFVHISSVAALGRRSKSELISEDRKWEEDKMNTHYAISKHKAELEVWRGFAEGLEGVIINPSTILGFGDWHQSSCAIFKNAYKEFSWYTKGMNGFVGVEDVAEAAVQLLCSNITEERFIINSDNISFQDLFNSIAEDFGKKKPHREATKLLGSIAWRWEMLKSFFTGKKPLLTKETAKVAHCQTRFDNAAVLKALSFTFTPLKEVVKNTCEKYDKALQAGQITL